jgi:hypothetical protein
VLGRPAFDNGATTLRSAQKPPYDRAGSAKIDDAGVALAKYAHHLDQVPHARGSGFGDGGPCRRLDFPVIELAGKKCFDNRDLLTFPLREIVPVALLKERNRFVALLYHCLQHPLNFR